MSSLTVVMVPGAFHVAWVMDILGAQLQQRGYNTRTSGLKSVNKPNVSVAEDATLLAEGILKPLAEEGRDVVLYLHSYAGFPGSAAITGLSKAERTAGGLQGGIVGLIFKSAFIPKVGHTLLQMIGGTYAPWQDPDETTGLSNVIDPKNTFDADVAEPLASEAANKISGQSLLSYNSPAALIYYQDAAYDGRRVYLHTTEDQAFPPFAQDLFVNGSGTTWKVVKVNTSHSPFLSIPDQLADVVQREIQAFTDSFGSVKRVEF